MINHRNQQQLRPIAKVSPSFSDEIGMKFPIGALSPTIIPIGAKPTNSLSVPNLRRTFTKSNLSIEPVAKSLSRTFQGSNPSPPHPIPTRRSNSFPTLPHKQPPFSAKPIHRHPLHIPSYDKKVRGMTKGCNLPSASDMIIGALRAGDSYFQRGMRHGDLFEVVRSVYDCPNNVPINTSLKQALEKLVAGGIVSKSYGTRVEDTTYRLVISKSAREDPSRELLVKGQGIKPSSTSTSRLPACLCLPGSASLDTRIPRNPGNAIGIQKLPPGRMIKSLPKAYLSSSDPMLTKSLAERAGAQEHLKPQNYRPNSPTTPPPRHSMSLDSLPISPSNKGFTSKKDFGFSSIRDKFRLNGMNNSPQRPQKFHQLVSVEEESNGRIDGMNDCYYGGGGDGGDDTTTSGRMLKNCHGRMDYSNGNKMVGGGDFEEYYNEDFYERQEYDSDPEVKELNRMLKQFEKVTDFEDC